jgi:hypothetical protein
LIWRRFYRFLRRLASCFENDTFWNKSCQKHVLFVMDGAMRETNSGSKTSVYTYFLLKSWLDLEIFSNGIMKWHQFINAVGI